MNCSTFQTLKLAAPRQSTAQQQEHMHVCTDCQQFAREVDAFEASLERAAGIAVPEGLAEGIILRLREKSRFTRVLDALRDWIGSTTSWVVGPAVGAGAALVVVAIAGLLVYQADNRRAAFADQLIAHVLSEPNALLAEASLDSALLATALATYGARLTGPAGEVRHMTICLVDGVPAHHVVLQTADGPVTLILLPGEPRRVRSRSRGGFTAVVVPLGRGSLGIVTQTPESASRAKSFITQRVQVEG